jgi:sialic acid synthase SpsE
MIQINGKSVGDDSPCFITFEAGPTHDGLDSALSLVRIAAESGADAIKFQMLDSDRLVADKQQPFSYEVLLDRESGRTETVSEPLYEILKRRELSDDQWRVVKTEAERYGLAFFSTALFPEDIKRLVTLGAESIKIASSDIDHFPLIRQAARTGLCIQLDTGNSTLGEIEAAVDVVVAEGNRSIVIHQCPSGYPARLPSIQLRMIQTLKQMFPFPVAFSDHTPGWDMDIAAVALGANMVEKTITHDRCKRAVEHMFSLEGDEPRRFVRSIRDVETALGSPRRTFSEEERHKHLATRRSIFLARDKVAGDEIQMEDLEFRRPGYGISPKDAGRVVGSRAAHDIPAGCRLNWWDLA